MSSDAVGVSQEPQRAGFTVTQFEFLADLRRGHRAIGHEVVRFGFFGSAFFGCFALSVMYRSPFAGA